MNSPADRQLPKDWHARHGWDFWLDYDAGTWEPDTHEHINTYVRPGSTYVDIGAWVGGTVLWAAEHAGRIIAVEPDTTALGCLLYNTKLLPQVEIIAGAITDHTGTAILRAHTEGWGASMSRLEQHGMPNNVWNEAASVNCWTLPDLFDEYDIEDVSLVKMDIEGGEDVVLETACPFLAERGITFLVSLHQDWWARPVLREWFDCFSEVRGTWGAYNALLCLP